MTELGQCPNGHFYDKGRYAACPVCTDALPVLEIPAFPKFDKWNIPNPVPTEPESKAEPAIGEEPYLFVSYAHRDLPEVEHFFRLMRDNHIRFWFDEGIKSGREWSDEISGRIRGCVQFLLFVSADALESENVKDEVHLAVKYGKEIIRVHLDTAELHGGLELKLDRKQALYRHKYAEPEFERLFCSSLNRKACDGTSENGSSLMERLQERYRLDSCIAQGGTSKVYTATDKITGCKVIIKSASVGNSLIGSSVKEYFRVEKEVLAKRISCFVPEILDCCFADDSLFLVESFVEGIPLEQMKRLTRTELIERIIQTAQILKRYHAQGIVHCDIKPKHILCGSEGTFLIDFGSAKGVMSSENRYLVGTPGYAAPEQYGAYSGSTDAYGENTVILEGTPGKIDERTDIFCLGRTLKRMLRECDAYRKNPMWEDTETTVALFSRLRVDGVTDPLEIDDPLLRAIADKMTMENKADRFRSMDEVIRVLKDYLKLRNQVSA